MFPRRGAIALGLTSIALILLVSFRTPVDTSATGDAALRPGATGTSGSIGSSSGGSSSATGSVAAGQGGTRTVDGPVVDTRYGPVQVSITVANGQLTDVTALQLPDGDQHSSSISSAVEPMLRSEALQAHGASIDGVSGATYTSTAYARSLQAALDSAGL